MHAKYIKKEIPDLNGTGRTQAYYKMELTSMNFDEFVSLCAREGHMEESSILGVLSLVSEKLALSMAEGYSVKLDGIGTFNAKLGVRDDKLQNAFEEGESRRNAHSIRVTGVAYRADGSLTHNGIDGAAPSGSRPHVGDYQQRHSKPKVLRASEYLGYDGLRVSKKEKEHPMRGAPNYYVSIYNQRSALFSIKYTSLLRSVCLKSKVLVCLLILTYSMPSISAKSSQYSSVMS